MVGKASLGAVFAALALALAPGVAGAATITPNVLTDEDTSNSDCSLREAVTLANGDHGGSYNGCTAADEDDDTIVLQSGQTYALSLPTTPSENLNANGDLDVLNEGLRIESSGAGIATIDGNGATTGDRVIQGGDFQTLTSTPTLDLFRIELTDGDTPNAGGGILIDYVGATTIDESRINANVAGAGGGIRADGFTTITETSISGNQTDSAGAAGVWASSGLMEISGSSVTGNIAAGVAGGVFADTGGAARLTNTTVSGNSATASGGGIFTQGGLDLRNATIANNTADSDSGGAAGDGGGVFRTAGTANVRNSIIADNLDGGGPNVHPDCSGTLTGQGYNLVEDMTGCTFVGDTTGNTSGSPNLQPLAFAGGLTLSHPLAGVNAARGAGNPAAPGSGGNACEATDQRGQPRIGGFADGSCDIGAYEVINPHLNSTGDKSVEAGENLSFTLSNAALNEPGYLTLFNVAPLPAGATFTGGNTFSWTPTAAQAGTHPVQLQVGNGIGTTDTEDITITVTTNPPPEIPKPDPPAKPKKCKKGQKLKKGKCVKKKRKKRK